MLLLFLLAPCLSWSSNSAPAKPPVTHRWWKEVVAYEVYPRSFSDSDGNGIGDIQGIIHHLDYIKSLGVKLVWIYSLYPSPNVDYGYDVSNYENINPELGTMADFEQLVKQMHKRGLKLQMELVSNHTSDEHPWFQASRKSKDNPYREYYFWRPPRDGGPPNNWPSLFGGSAWEVDAATGEYYLHYFNKKQVDLNWDNPKVRQEIYNIERFWLNKGVDGFRMDVITLVSKDPTFSDLGPRGLAGFEGGPHEHQYLQEMNREVLSHYKSVTVGEGAFVPMSAAPLYTADDRHELNMLFLFDHYGLGRGPEKYSRAPFDLQKLKSIVQQWDDALGHSGWNAPFLESCDMPRIVSAWGDEGKYRVASAKMLATFLLTLRGTPYIYQGQEIGMTNAHYSSLRDFRDIEARQFIDDMRAKNISDDEILSRLNNFGRDNARTPMQWDGSQNGGFSTAASTWLKVNADYPQINVQQSEQDPDSILNYYRAMIALRKRTPALIYGEYQALTNDASPIFSYIRTLGHKRVLVVLNFSGDPISFSLPALVHFKSAKIMIANDLATSRDLRNLQLAPYDAVVYELR